jgi:acetyl esterase/lipase
VTVRFYALFLFSCCALAQSTVPLMTPQQFQALPAHPADERIAYGSETDQFGELRVPPGAGPHPVVVLIHGGCWRADFSNLHEMGPIADALKAKGVATWNLEYRRLGESGAGWPGTYLDVARGVDHLKVIASSRNLDLKRVVIVGHSAGGHLALWAAGRRHVPVGSAIHSDDPLPIKGVIDLAGTPDMARFFPRQRAMCGGRAVVEEMLGGTPDAFPERYAAVSAFELLPSDAKQTLVWGRSDPIAPLDLAEHYVAEAKRKKQTVRLLTFDGIGHFEIATPFPPAWPVVEKEITGMLGK